MIYPVHFEITDDPKWKYKTLEDYTINIPWLIEYLQNYDEMRTLTCGYITYDIKTDTLKIAKGYTWDGPSGPALDTSRFMAPSLFHDALYQLIRKDILLKDVRRESDKLLKSLCIQQGMNRIIAYIAYYIVRLFGGTFVKSEVKETC